LLLERGFGPVPDRHESYLTLKGGDDLGAEPEIKLFWFIPFPSRTTSRAWCTDSMPVRAEIDRPGRLEWDIRAKSISAAQFFHMARTH
jgi:hypothetical protein